MWSEAYAGDTWRHIMFALLLSLSNTHTHTNRERERLLMKVHIDFSFHHTLAFVPLFTYSKQTHEHCPLLTVISIKTKRKTYEKGKVERGRRRNIGQKQQNVRIVVCTCLCVCVWMGGYKMCLKEWRFHTSVTLSLCTCSMKQREGGKE